MPKTPSHDPFHAAAEAIRRACLEAALDAREQAGLAGLCEDGRMELMLDAMRTLDVDEVLRSLGDRQH